MSLKFSDLVGLLIFEPILKFLGYNAVIQAWPEKLRCEAGITKKVGGVCLFFLGIVNCADTILDLATSMRALVLDDECDNSSWEALLLFAMTLLAGYVRNVNDEIEYVYYNPKDWYHQAIKYIMMESVVFTIEDGASIFYLATRPCALTNLDWASLCGTFASFVPIALVLVFFLLASLWEFCAEICGNTKDANGENGEDVDDEDGENVDAEDGEDTDKNNGCSQSLGSFIYSATFVAFFSYQIVIVLKIFNNRENSSSERSLVLDDDWYNATLIVYVVCVVLIPSCVVIIVYAAFGGFKKKLV